MRARTFVFALVLGTATAALAQDGGYVRFPSPSPQSCAVACAGDQMCASWTFGTAARSYGQSQTRSEGAGMCTFSGSSTVRNSPGIVSGLPRRDPTSAPIPMMSAPPQMMGQPMSQSAPPQPVYRAPSQATTSGSGWDVRPAPWLSGNGGGQAPPQPQGYPAQQGYSAQRGQPQQIARDVPPIPSPTPSAAPRIEFDPSPSQASGPYARPPMTRPVAPMPAPPIYVPPAPAYQPPAPVYAPAPVMAPPPPRTEAIPDMMGAAPSAEAAPMRPSPGRGIPKNRTRPQAAAPVTTAPMAAAPPTDSDSTASVALPTRRSAPAAARGTPRNRAPAVPTAAPSSAAPSAAAAPPRQETAARPTAGRGAPRAPVRDPSNPESFRGADGMIDAAEMRRAQLNAAREQGTPAYSVQREWEAVAAERQRAEDAGEVRVDPLAGTSPVAPPPETRAERRAREAEETAAAAEEARAAARANGDDPEEVAAPARRAPSRGARGTPRPKPAPRQTSQNDGEQQVAQNRRTSRSAPQQALDREPRLSGGPG